MPVWAQGRISLRSFELMHSLIWRNTETCFTSEAIAQLNFMSVEQEANPRSQSLLCCVNDRLFLSVWSWWRFSVSVKWRMEGTPRLASFLSLLSVVQAPQVGTMLPCQEMLSNNWEIRWLAVVPTFQQFWLEMGWFFTAAPFLLRPLTEIRIKWLPDPEKFLPGHFSDRISVFDSWRQIKNQPLLTFFFSHIWPIGKSW